ncbi:MAG: 2-C-methyl-D-erythritol 4-phosphate cytidylyltransferase [Propionibacteriaceae bacterium]|nr:2-C-methyl-D-erythritol 4-phosphate cytidylyltransferase [Propionibacteriaceae bacterium]
MNTAIIIAGGTGVRMGLEVPKQFALVEGKPVLIYTLQAFQDHPSIDSIGVVCVDGWNDILHDYALEYGITKLDWIIPGGATAQESIYSGVRHLEGVCHPNDTVVIHDGIRPLVDASVISGVLATCHQYGNGVASLPYNEQIFRIDADEDYSTVEYIPRDTLRRVSTPQAYHYDVLASRYKEAFEKGVGIGKSAYTNTMMVDLGERLYFSVGSDKNIKLTNPDDLALFQALLRKPTELPSSLTMSF